MLLQGQAYASKAQCTIEYPKEQPKYRIENLPGGYKMIIIPIEAKIVHCDGTTTLYKDEAKAGPYSEADYNDPEIVEWVAAESHALEVNFTLMLEKEVQKCHPQQ